MSESAQQARDPKQDPEPGDVIQMAGHSRHVSARSPQFVWFHAKCGSQWLNKTCKVSLKEWREDVAEDASRIIGAKTE